MVFAQEVIIHQQKAFPKTVPPGNYSGIAWLGGSCYAVVNDKSPTDGFHLMTIETDSITGELLSVKADTFLTSGKPNRDAEGICYVPHTNTIFISGEADMQILEYNLQGHLTGRRLQMPDVFNTAHVNANFEALTYQPVTHRFWTTTEVTLMADGVRPTLNNKARNRLRLQSFGDDLQPLEQYWYISDSVELNKQKGEYVLGVSGLAALDDGRLVVLEREVFLPRNKVGSFVHVKLYSVDPSLHQAGETLQKKLLAQFRTKMNLTRRDFAIYEGICLGSRLVDGRQLLVLISDSQDQYRGFLKDWFKTIVISQ